MIRFGIISEIKTGRARVRFEDDDTVSALLPVSVPFTKGNQVQFPLQINQHVWCMMDENSENGVIGGAIYDESNEPAGWSDSKYRLTFGNWLSIEIDEDAKKLKIEGQSDVIIDVEKEATIKCNTATVEALLEATVKGGVKITLDAPAIVCTGPVSAPSLAISGAATIDGNIQGDGDLTLSGNISADQITGNQVKEGSIRLGTHKHSGVTTGGGTSATPVP